MTSSGATRSPTPPADAAGIPPLRAVGLSVGRDEAPLVRDLSLALCPGELLVVVGPNGAGKTTLLHTLAGVLPPLAGEVWLGDRPLSALDARQRARRVALLPQVDEGDGSLTVRELVELGRTPHLGLWGALGPADRRAVEQAMAACQVEALADRPLAEVSGGERQRARIALSLAQQSPLLLLDEPVNHLDLRRRYHVFSLLAELRRELALAVVVVLHDLADAFREADRLLLLGDGEARPLDPADPGCSEHLARTFGVPLAMLPPLPTRSPQEP